MNRCLARALFLPVTLCVGCTSESKPAPRTETDGSDLSQGAIQLEFLTRDGCANTSVLLDNLKAVAQSFDSAVEIEVIDQGTLPATDPRTGYSTPTILFNDRDLFGLPEPVRPFPAPG